MPITIRFAAIALAVMFIGLSLLGVFGAWFVDRKTTDVALKGFGLIETGVQVVDAGVGRVNDLIATSKMEVRQASETIAAVGAHPRLARALLDGAAVIGPRRAAEIVALLDDERALSDDVVAA